MCEQASIRFGQYELDPIRGDLRRDGRPVPIAPQPLRVLSILAGRAGELVTRVEIQDRIWPGELSSVTREQGLNACVARIRDALGDSADAPVYVQTHPKRGYRFIAPVESVGAPGRIDGVERHEPRPLVGNRLPVGRRRPSLWVIAGLAALGLLLAVGLRVAGGGPLEVSAGTGAAALPGDLRLAFLTGERLLAAQTVEGVRRSLAHFARVAREEPGFVPGRIGYATALFRVGRRDDAEREARQVLLLNPASPEAHQLLGDIRLDRDFAWADAERHYRRALELGRGRHEFPHAYAHFLVSRGRTGEALASLRRALELDPMSPVLASDIGWVEYWAGRYDRAATACIKGAILLPLEIRTRAQRCALHALVRLGRYEEARERALEIMDTGRATLTAMEQVRTSSARRSLDLYYRWSVRPENWLVALGSRSPYARARGLADLGDVEGALALLEVALESRPRGLTTLAVEPRFAEFREHPRFVRIVDRIGLAGVEAPGT